MLFSGILEQLAESDNPVVLTGHLHPDYDSAAACLLMQHFLRQCGVDVQICLYGEMDAHGAAVLQKYGYVPGSLFAPVPENALLILCDCHTAKLPGRVIACADHHPTMEAPGIPVYLNKRASSAGRVVYQAAMAHGLQADREIDFLALSSIYMDTLSCCSSKFQKEDKPWIQAAADRWGFDLVSLQRDGLCLTDMSLPPNMLARNGFREYIFGTYHLASSYIQVQDEDPALEQELLNCCRKACIEGAYDGWVFLYYVPIRKTTDVYRYDRHTGIWSGEHHSVILSRGNDVIPALEHILHSRIV